MFAKWNLNRNPFYTQPIDTVSLFDFAGRNEEIKDLKIKGLDFLFET